MTAKRAQPASAAKRGHWLFKSDPESFGFDDLWRARKRTSGWDGVRNHQARNFLRDSVRVGDLVLIHHSSADPVGIAGVARIASAPRPDPTQFDPKDDHHDAKSKRQAPTWFEVDVQALARCPHFVSLAELRSEPRLSGLLVLRPGQRLSIQPVEAADFAVVLELAGLRLADLDS